MLIKPEPSIKDITLLIKKQSEAITAIQDFLKETAFKNPHGEAINELLSRCKHTQDSVRDIGRMVSELISLVTIDVGAKAQMDRYQMRKLESISKSLNLLLTGMGDLPEKDLKILRKEISQLKSQQQSMSQLLIQDCRNIFNEFMCELAFNAEESSLLKSDIQIKKPTRKKSSPSRRPKKAL